MVASGSDAGRVEAVAVAACGGSGEATEESPPTPAPGEAIYSLAVDPADGTLMAATAPGFYRVAAGGGEPQPVTATLKSDKGSGAVKDLVMRFTGAGTLIASGHAAEPSLATNVGLARSTDHGKTWQPVSGQGEADYHELEVAGDRLYGLRTDSGGVVNFSSDGGRTFETRNAPAAATPIDIAVNQQDPAHWAISNASGTSSERLLPPAYYACRCR